VSDDRFSSGLSERYLFFRSVRRRIAATLAVVVGGFVGMVLYLAFVAAKFAWYVNLFVVLGWIVVIPLAVVAIWVLWGLRFAQPFHRPFWFDDEFF